MPSVPSFAVDRGFWYALPPSLDFVDLGWMVRVPLGGRRVRGHVVERAVREATGLKDVAAASGEAPVFDGALLETLQWAAWHYVAPLSVLLERAAPPNLPRVRDLQPSRAEREPTQGPLDDLAEAVAAGRRHRPVAWVEGGVPHAALRSLASRLLAVGGTLCVVAPTSAEVREVAAGLGEVDGVVDGEIDDRAVTEAWAVASQQGGVLVGTPRVAAWLLRRPAVLVVLEDGRRAMKDRQTPTIHVRDLGRARSLREGIGLVAAGPTPSVEIVGAGAEVRRAAERRRAWPSVEVVDRSQDPPGGGLLSDTARMAVRAVVARRGRVFVYGHRRGYAAASRCASCREVRRCPTCGSRPDGGDACRRCGSQLGPCPGCGGARFEPLGAGVGRLVEEARRLVGREAASPYPAESAVTVGTERDLVELPRSDLVVLVDLDGLVLGTNFRAAEEALRIGARLALRVAPGGRLLVQTSQPGHPVVEALRRGDPEPFLRQELGVREAMGYPPAGELVVVEARGGVEPGEADRHLREVAGEAMLLGPAEGRDGWRWLAQGRSLRAFRRELRAVVQRWRDSGATVRIDVDPIDL